MQKTPPLHFKGELLIVYKCVLREVEPNSGFGIVEGDEVKNFSYRIIHVIAFI